MEPETDEMLIAEFRQGNEEAFAHIVRRHLVPLYSFIYRFARNEPLAEDIVQEAFVAAWSKLSQYKSQYSFKSWLWKIARNKMIDQLRKKQPATFSSFATADTAIEESFEDSALTPLEAVLAQESHHEIEAVLSTISEQYREVVVLHVQDGLTFEEIAEVVGRPMNTVKSQYRRAIRRLHDALAPKTGGAA